MPIMVATIQTNTFTDTTAALVSSSLSLIKGFVDENSPVEGAEVGVVVGVLDEGAMVEVVVKLSVLVQNPGVSTPHKSQ